MGYTIIMRYQFDEQTLKYALRFYSGDIDIRQLEFWIKAEGLDIDQVHAAVKYINWCVTCVYIRFGLIFLLGLACVVLFVSRH